MYLLIARTNYSLTCLILNKFLFVLNSGRLVQFQQRPRWLIQPGLSNLHRALLKIILSIVLIFWLLLILCVEWSMYTLTMELSALQWAQLMHSQLKATLLMDKNSPFFCCAYIGEVGVSNLWHTLCTLIEQFVCLPVGLAGLGLKACMKGVSRRITLTLQFPWCDQSGHISGSIYLHNWGRGVGIHLFILTCCMLCWPKSLYA